MLHTLKVLSPSLSEISVSLLGSVNATRFNTPQENFGEFAGYKFCVTDYTGRIFSKLVPIQLSCRKDFCHPDCAGQLVKKIWVEVQGYLLVRLQNVRVSFDCFIPVNELVCYRFTEILMSSASQV